MTTPTTPTGKRHAAYSEHYGGIGSPIDLPDIPAIEAEAAAQERASLLEEHCAGHDDTDGPCETCELLKAKT